MQRGKPKLAESQAGRCVCFGSSSLEAGAGALNVGEASGLVEGKGGVCVSGGTATYCYCVSCSIK